VSMLGRRRPGGVSMATRLAGAVLAVSFVALAVATVVGVDSGSDLGRQIYRDRLRALDASGAFDVAAELAGTRAATLALASSPQAVDALGRFDRAFEDLQASVDTDPERAGVNVPSEPAAVELQRNYPPATATSGGAGVDDAGDGSAWSRVHREFHPAYRRAVEELGLVDLYLIEADSSRIVYSVNKQFDLGTSLTVGPFSGSVLANTVDQAIGGSPGGTVVSDLSFYAADPDRVIGVMAQAVLDGTRLVGVLAVTYDAGDLTEILTVDQSWDEAGYPDTADLYLVSADGTLRSDPRSFLEDPAGFLDASESAGSISGRQRSAIERTGTAVLTQPAVGATVIAGMSGDDGVEERTSMMGTQVISTITPIAVDGLDWYVVAEMERWAAEAGLREFREVLVVGTALFVVVIAFFAVSWASRIMRPVRIVSERLGSTGLEPGALVIPERSPVELQQLAASFESMSSTLEREHRKLAEAREQRLELMRQMLPRTIADRVARGDLEGTDEVPHASVVVLVVLGLGELVRVGSAGSNRDLVDRLHSELDGLAEQHGLDRVKVVGDTYFAACGHDRPLIDHASRAVAFATDARDAVRSLGQESGAALDVAVGIHTGPVTVGMTGGARLVYDVWGETVTTAHHLARRGRRGDVLISERTQRMLPDHIPSERASDVLEAPVWSVPMTAMGDLR
jgi:class 3 adenylate cyclase